MRFRVKWFNIDVIFNGNESKIREKSHSKGKYCKRTDIEPFIRRIESDHKAKLDGLRNIKSELTHIEKCIKASGDKDAIDSIHSVKKKLSDMISQGKKSSRKPKLNEDIDTEDQVAIDMMNNRQVA